MLMWSVDSLDVDLHSRQVLKSTPKARQQICGSFLAPVVEMKLLFGNAETGSGVAFPVTTWKKPKLPAQVGLKGICHHCPAMAYFWCFFQPFESECVGALLVLITELGFILILNLHYLSERNDVFDTYLNVSVLCIRNKLTDWFILQLKMYGKGLGDGLVDKALTTHSYGPEFRLTAYIKSRVTQCTRVTSALEA